MIILKDLRWLGFFVLLAIGRIPSAPQMKDSLRERDFNTSNRESLVNFRVKIVDRRIAAAAVGQKDTQMDAERAVREFIKNGHWCWFG